MIDVLGTLVARAYNYLLMVVEIVERYFLYLLAHCSREEKCISIRWYILEDGIDALGETLFTCSN